jgi:hypothetical protein
MNDNPYTDNKVIKGMIKDHKELERKCELCKIKTKKRVCEDCSRIIDSNV